MESDEIRQCRFCGIHTEFEAQRTGYDLYRAICKTCGTRGPLVNSAGGAIECWQEMMAPQVQATLETVDTSYRDRVGRMVGYYISAMILHRSLPGTDEKYIAEWAIRQVDAIDKALAEREVKQ